MVQSKTVSNGLNAAISYETWHDMFVTAEVFPVSKMRTPLRSTTNPLETGTSQLWTHGHACLLTLTLTNPFWRLEHLNSDEHGFTCLPRPLRSTNPFWRLGHVNSDEHGFTCLPRPLRSTTNPFWRLGHVNSDEHGFTRLRRHLHSTNLFWRLGHVNSDKHGFTCLPRPLRSTNPFWRLGTPQKVDIF